MNIHTLKITLPVGEIILTYNPDDMRIHIRGNSQLLRNEMVRSIGIEDKDKMINRLATTMHLVRIGESIKTPHSATIAQYHSTINFINEHLI